MSAIESSRAPASYSYLFALTTGLLLSIGATGIYGGIFFSHSPLTQAMLLTHLGLGAIFLLPFIVYLVYHVYVVYRSKIMRTEWVSQILGLLLAMATVGAAASGVQVTQRGATHRNANLVLTHQVCSYVSLVLLPLHVLWAARRRRVLGRPAWVLDSERVVVPLCILACSGVSALIISVSVRPPLLKFPVPASYTYVKNQQGNRQPFFPGQARTTDGQLFPVDNLSGSATCAHCHDEIYKQWRSSTHSFAASNDHYLAQVKLRIFDVPAKPHMGARFCANCHEPIAMFAGEIDKMGRGIEIPENREEGLSCLSCHQIERLHSKFIGNANFVIGPHQPYLFEKSSSPVAATAGRLLIRSSPALHRTELMRPLLRSSDFCSSCHKFFIDEAVNGHGFFRLQNTYDEWKNSPYANKGQKEFQRCQDCHMPKVESRDPAAKPVLEDGRLVYKVASHYFLGANTARPFLDGDAEQLARTEAFLKNGSVVLNLEIPPHIAADQTVPVKVNVFNRGVGHRFPTGTVDTHDCWVELIVTDADGHEIYHSGALQKDGAVDPTAHTFNARGVDENGNWLYRRDMWNLAGWQYMVTIFPKTTDSHLYTVKVPAGTKGPLKVEGRLNYRKLNQAFTRFAFGRGPFREGSLYTGPHSPETRLPITVMSSDTATVPVSGQR